MAENHLAICSVPRDVPVKDCPVCKDQPTADPLTVVSAEGLVRETAVLEFLGYLSASITELHNIEVPRLKDAWDRYKSIVEAAVRDGAYL